MSWCLGIGRVLVIVLYFPLGCDVPKNNVLKFTKRFPRQKNNIKRSLLSLSSTLFPVGVGLYVTSSVERMQSMLYIMYGKGYTMVAIYIPWRGLIKRCMAATP